MSLFFDKIPQKYVADLEKAVEILKGEGCAEIFIFGSLINGSYHENSDIDIAVKGLPAGKYFKVIGRLLLELDNPADLVDLDDKTDSFSRLLTEKGDLVRVS